MGSTDFPYTGYGAMTPIQCISMAVTRIGIDGVTPPEYMSNQAITPDEALRSLTIDAAYGTFQEDVKGSIKVGKYADLVVLSQNPLTVPEQDINDTQILMTIIGGKEEYKVDNFYEESTTLSTTPKNTPFPIISTFFGIIVLFHYLDKKRRKL
jgi:predicted amidohydrolase YtcJ